MPVRIDEGGEAAVVLNNQGVYHVHKVIDGCFHFLRVDVLAGRAKHHALGAAFQEQVTVLVYDTHVSGTEPAVLCE